MHPLRRRTLWCRSYRVRWLCTRWRGLDRLARGCRCRCCLATRSCCRARRTAHRSSSHPRTRAPRTQRPRYRRCKRTPAPCTQGRRLERPCYPADRPRLAAWCLDRRRPGHRRRAAACRGTMACPSPCRGRGRRRRWNLGGPPYLERPRLAGPGARRLDPCRASRLCHAQDQGWPARHSRNQAQALPPRQGRRPEPSKKKRASRPRGRAVQQAHRRAGAV